MFKLTLLVIVFASSIIFVGHTVQSWPDNPRLAAHRKAAKPTPDCPPAGKRNGRADCGRATQAPGEGGRTSKAGSKVLFDRTVF